jgi:hypothetical protein
MNLTRVLNVALPEIPARVFARNPPRVPPGTVHKEHIENGERVVLAVVPNKSALYRFPPENWELIQLFDGNKSFSEIAASTRGKQAQLTASRTCANLPPLSRPWVSGTKRLRKRMCK